jgi:hypothetical protein
MSPCYSYLPCLADESHFHFSTYKGTWAILLIPCRKFFRLFQKFLHILSFLRATIHKEENLVVFFVRFKKFGAVVETDFGLW